MTFTSRIFAFMLLLLINITARAQADIKLPPARSGEPYSQSIQSVLRETYGLDPQLPSGGRLVWRALGGLPPGLDIDRQTGRIYGTPAEDGERNYRLMVQVLTPSTRPTVLTTYRLILDLLSRSEVVAARDVVLPATAPVEAVALTQTGVRGADTKSASAGMSDDVEIPAVIPSKTLELPITIRKDSIRQLEVLVFDKDDKLVDSQKTPDNLPRGEVQTSVKLTLAEGRNTIQVRDADTKEVYRLLVVNLTQAARGGGGGARKSAIEIKHAGYAPPEENQTPLTVVVNDPAIRAIDITVTSKKDGTTHSEQTNFALKRGEDEYPFLVTLSAGENAVTVSDAANPGNKATLDIKRDLKLKRPDVEVLNSTVVGKKAETVPLSITVNNPKISTIKLRVKGMKDKQKVDEKVIDLPRGVDTVPLLVTLAKNDTSLIEIYDWSGKDKEKEIAESDHNLLEGSPVEISRSSKTADTIADINVNGLNTRAIVGFEQSGASASGSEGKPFLDFFFTAPIRYKPYGDELPRASVWASLRLASIPQQVAAFGTFASNFVNPLAEGQLGSNKLVQGFDFVVGPEFRLFGTNKAFPSVIPGVKNQTKVYIAGGFGAISPLTTDKDSAQIFQTPGADSPQRENFLKLYPDAKDKKYIAFVFPDRDRFLRQYYLGLRFKTHFYDEEGLINRFPAIFDLMFGQNEAATGGKLKNVVMRLEGFYPFPVREANFLYLYGTAMMKFGGGGVNISTPLFLDTADSTVSITNKDVFIAPTRQASRDYYRIGIGVNLTELFNRKPSSPK